jgi:hypothetical protein
MCSLKFSLYMTRERSRKDLQLQFNTQETREEHGITSTHSREKKNKTNA